MAVTRPTEPPRPRASSEGRSWLRAVEPAHRHSGRPEERLTTVPLPRFAGMDWPGDDEVAHVPVALLLAARGECSCDACCERFVHLVRRSRLRSV